MRTLTCLPVIALLALPLAGCEIEGTEGFEPERFTGGGGGGGGGFTPAPPPAQSRSFTILHTNDEHSHLLGFGPNTDYPFTPVPGDSDGSATTVNALTKIAMGAQTRGGFARRDYLLNKLRQEATNPVVTVSAGDSTMGTLFHLAGTQGAPDWLAMTLAGYDYMTLGNHEFDFGPDALALTIQAGSNLSFGTLPKIIASNMNFPAGLSPADPGFLLSTQVGDGGSGALIQPWDVKVLANGLRVGFLGAMGYAAALVAPTKSPVFFSVPRDGETCTTTCTNPMEACIEGVCVDPLDDEGHVAAAAADLQNYVSALRGTVGVDVVVLISHMGTREDMAIAQLTSGIDILIGGHSHDYLPAFVVDGTSTIVVQTSGYGTELGELTVVVDPDGTVTLDETRTTLHDVDWTLDSEIIEGTDLPGTISPALERAISLTAGVIGPTADGLNAQFLPSVNLLMGDPFGDTYTNLWSSTLADETALFDSNHDILGSGPSMDSHLSHLVTDAEWETTALAGCLVDVDGLGSGVSIADASFMVTVQANGAIRDALEFGVDGSASFADVYRVLPNGGSPFQPTVPAFPLVAFQLRLDQLVAGVDIGITRGLEDDEFFLSYSGMKIEYNEDFPPFDPLTFNPTSTLPQSRLARMSIGTDRTGYTEIFHYDPADSVTPWESRWTGVALTDRVVVVTNLYLAGFMEGFGLTPLHPYSGNPITPSTSPAVPDSLKVLAKTVLCNVDSLENLDCTDPNPTVSNPVIRPCVDATGGDVPANGVWPDGLVEAKEWAILYGYLLGPLGGIIPDCLYETDTGCETFPSRVTDVTPDP